MEDIAHHPFVLRLYNGEESYTIRVYVWKITHGGGQFRPSDEFRVQITGVNQFEQEENEKTIILGWWEEGSVFAGFDYTKHDGSLGVSPSFQIRKEALEKAYRNGFSSCEKSNNEIAIAFRPDFFVQYVQSLESLHAFGTSSEEINTIDLAADITIELNTSNIGHLSEPRKEIISKIRKKWRDLNFKARVLTAYGNRCAFSGMQMKLVDAAHIVPVSCEESNDCTSNGIALSALYHRAFDKGYITLDEQYRIIVNEQAMENLTHLELDGGIESFRSNLKPLIILPPAVTDRPNIDFIRIANRLRGWSI